MIRLFIQYHGNDQVTKGSYIDRFFYYFHKSRVYSCVFVWVLFSKIWELPDGLFCHFLQKRSTNLAVLKGYCKKQNSQHCYFTELPWFIFTWVWSLDQWMNDWLECSVFKVFWSHFRACQTTHLSKLIGNYCL